MATTKANRYSTDFKIEAVKKARLHGNRAETARLLDVHVNTLSKWIKEFEKEEISIGNALNNEELVEPIQEENTFSTEVEDLSEMVVQLKDINEQLTHENAELKAEVQTFKDTIEGLRKELKNSEQLIGRLFKEKVELENFSNKC